MAKPCVLVLIQEHEACVTGRSIVQGFNHLRDQAWIDLISKRLCNDCCFTHELPVPQDVVETLEVTSVEPWLQFVRIHPDQMHGAT